MKKHFALDSPTATSPSGAEISTEARLNGIYVVGASLPTDNIGTEQAVAPYQSFAERRSGC